MEILEACLPMDLSLRMHQATRIIKETIPNTEPVAAVLLLAQNMVRAFAVIRPLKPCVMLLLLLLCCVVADSHLTLHLLKVDTSHTRQFLSEQLDRTAMRRFMCVVSTAFGPLIGSTTGKYKLDMTKKWDRIAALKVKLTDKDRERSSFVSGGWVVGWVSVSIWI